jgi:hypothetical protein
MSRVFVVKISLPRPIKFTVEAESEDEAYSKAEEAILRAMEKGEFSVKVEQAE